MEGVGAAALGAARRDRAGRANLTDLPLKTE